MPALGTLQIGKNKLTQNFIETLKNYFKKHEYVKISVLKSCCRNRQELEKIAEEILGELGRAYTARIIGYTIVIKKWRKAVR